MTEYKQGFDYKNCPRCYGKGVVPEREQLNDKDFPTLIRCPECKSAELGETQ